MKKIAVVTFHRAHNFGSVLQTYALQEYIKQIGNKFGTDIEYKVIDFYTETQEDMYNVYKSGRSIRNIIKNIIASFYVKELKEKHNKFEEFIMKNIHMTKRFITENDLKKDIPDADYYISGSDQIWNVRAKDFSDIYFLDFVNRGRKISYAASFGPLKIDWNQYDKEKYAHLLNEYASVSVREDGSQENIGYLTHQECCVNVDPTLLLNCEQWRKIQSDANYNEGQYILLYCLEPSKEQLKMAKAISKKLKLPILVLRYNNKNDMFNSFVKRYDSGPTDFLAYIDHAALVLSSSFHGTAFSLIYHKPFYVFNGMRDNRIAYILTKTDMVDHSLESLTDVERVTLKKLNEETIELFIKEEVNKSTEYFRKALEFEGKKRIDVIKKYGCTVNNNY